MIFYLIEEQGYSIKSLVAFLAFSDSVVDDKIPDKAYTEIDFDGLIHILSISHQIKQCHPNCHPISYLLRNQAQSWIVHQI